MNLEISLKRVNQLMSRFVTEIKGETSMGRTDLNKAAETILIPLLNEIYGWKLENINYLEGDTNYPGIDLADKASRVCVQVTATTSAEKVKHTLEQFIRHKQYVDYDRLVVFCLKEKKQSYPLKAIQKILQDKLSFDIERDILDYRDLLREISSFQIERLTQILTILELNFGEEQRLKDLSPRESESNGADLDPTEQNGFEIGSDFSGYLNFVSTDPRYRDVRELYTDTEALLTLEAKSSSRNEAERTFKVVEEIYEFVLCQPTRIDGSESDVDNKTCQTRHAVLSGRPGSGKSTTLKKLLLILIDLALSEKTQPVPVLVQLKGDKSILEHIETEFRRAKVRVDLQQIEDWLFEDRLILLLDGVNEIPSSYRRQALQAFREENPNISMIFTTRDLAIGGDLLGIDYRLEMCALNIPQMRDFVTKYLTSKGMSEHANRLLCQLDDRLREIAETPLLLKLLCDVFDPDTGQIPQSRGQLFQFFDADYDKHKGLTATSDDFRRFKPEILRYLAFCMIQGDLTQSTESWFRLDRGCAEKIVESFLSGRVEAPGQRAKEWLEDLLKHHLLQLAVDPRDIEFHHQLFQEYYAAEELKSRLLQGHFDLVDDQRFQYFYLNYMKWTEPLALMAAILENEEHAIRLVQLAAGVDRLFGSSLHEEIQPRFREKVSRVLESQEVPDFLKAQLPIRSTQLTKVNPVLTGQLQHRSFLGSDYEYIYSDLVKMLEEGNSLLDVTYPYAREIAAMSLGQVGYKQAVPNLVKALNDENIQLKWALPYALGLLGSDEAVPCLLQALDKEQFYIRWAAADVLEHLQSVRAIPGLIQALEHTDPYVQERAADGLKRFKGDLAAHAMPLLQKLIPTSCGELAFSVLRVIQVNSQYYRYDISQLKLAPSSSQNQQNGSSITNIEKVGILNTGPVAIQGDQKEVG